MASQLQERLQTAISEAGVDAERARKAVMEYQKQLKGKSAEEAAQIMEQRKTATQEQVQEAIKNLEQASKQVAAQVDKAKEQIQKRLEAKKEELKHYTHIVLVDTGVADLEPMRRIAQKNAEYFGLAYLEIKAKTKAFFQKLAKFAD